MCRCLLSVSCGKRHVETGTDGQYDDKDRQLTHVDMEPAVCVLNIDEREGLIVSRKTHVATESSYVVVVWVRMHV